MAFFFADNLLFFRKKMYFLDRLNMYQFLFQRTGIGKNISKRICFYTGHSMFYNAKKIKDNTQSKMLKHFFLTHSKQFDKNVSKLQSMSIDKLLKNRSYIGTRHRHKLPCRGQRTRTNNNTKKPRKKKHIKKR